jgi:APA family basic amino acid/polyamine antiporter
MAMAQDGLVPALFARVHTKYRTPHLATAICGITVAALAGLFPLSILVQLVSVGTLIVFIAVAMSVIVLRRTEPARARPFRTPFVPVVPILGTVVCVVLLAMFPLRTWSVYLFWLALGLSIYFVYGARSALRLRAQLQSS